MQDCQQIFVVRVLGRICCGCYFCLFQLPPIAPEPLNVTRTSSTGVDKAELPGRGPRGSRVA